MIIITPNESNNNHLNKNILNTHNYSIFKSYLKLEMITFTGLIQ